LVRGKPWPRLRKTFLREAERGIVLSLVDITGRSTRTLQGKKEKAYKYTEEGQGRGKGGQKIAKLLGEGILGHLSKEKSGIGSREIPSM